MLSMGNLGELFALQRDCEWLMGWIVSRHLQQASEEEIGRVHCLSPTFTWRQRCPVSRMWSTLFHPSRLGLMRQTGRRVPSLGTPIVFSLLSVISSNRTNEHVHTPWDVLHPILQVLHCASTCFHLPFLRYSSLSVSSAFLPPLVWEEGIARAKEDDTGRITLSPFLREILTGVINTQPNPPTPHSPSSPLTQQQQLLLCILCRLEETGKITQDPYFTSHGEAEA